MSRDFFISLCSAICLLALTTTELHAVNVIVAYQTEAEPAKVAGRKTALAKCRGLQWIGVSSIVARRCYVHLPPAMYKLVILVPVR